jgi:hypothetical protein
VRSHAAVAAITRDRSLCSLAVKRGQQLDALDAAGSSSAATPEMVEQIEPLDVRRELDARPERRDSD